MTPCQSCGIPLGLPKNLGTEADGAKSGDYCIRCYESGQFRDQLTVQEMQSRVYTFLTQELYYAEEQAQELVDSLPGLKRWLV